MKELEPSGFLISGSQSIKEAMKQIDRAELKVLFVIDDEKKLMGSLTDGDIRRWILGGGGLTSAVEQACFRDTFISRPGDSREIIKSEMLKRKIGQVPLVDSQQRIQKIIVVDPALADKNGATPIPPLSLPVVIMAGGRGTRLDPFTKILPKPLIPIGDRTIIEIIIDKFREYQVDRFILALHHKSKIIRAFFEEKNVPYRLDYLFEDDPGGTAGALRGLKGMDSESLVITNCDIIIEADYNDIVRFHEEGKNDVTIVGCWKNIRIPYGVCDIESGGRLVEIKEKPDFTYLVNTGFYVLRTEILDLIPAQGIYHMTDLIRSVREKSGGRVCVYPIQENAWADTGEWPEYLRVMEKIGR